MTIIDKHFTATGFIVRQKQVLLLHHQKLNMWLPFGGHLEAGEDPVQALLREAKEETGFDVEIVADVLDFQGPFPKVLPSPETILLEKIEDHHFHIDLIYFVRIVGGSQRISITEHTEQRWFSADDLTNGDIAEDVKRLGLLAIEKLS